MYLQIKSYQTVYANGQRDTVTLATPIVINAESIEQYRAAFKQKHGCLGINLTYAEVYEEKRNKK